LKVISKLTYIKLT